MELEIGKYYMDSEENVYRCVALSNGMRGYTEAVLQIAGYEEAPQSLIYCIFYRSHYAWMDRENPDYRLTEQVDYFPNVVMS